MSEGVQVHRGGDNVTEVEHEDRPRVGPGPGLSGSGRPVHPRHPLSQALRGSRVNEGRREPLASGATVLLEASDKQEDKTCFHPMLCIFLSQELRREGAMGPVAWP